MNEPSGSSWCDRFPGSSSVNDLAPAFRACLDPFLGALAQAGAEHSVAATYRPPERAYLMHFCCLVAGYRAKNGGYVQIQPGDVPPMGGVDIDWTHGGNVGAARSAAIEMRVRYGIAYPAALASRHTQRLAIDMSIRWAGMLTIKAASGAFSEISSVPRDGTNSQLALVGKTYGVIKLASDPPHWSSDGH